LSRTKRRIAVAIVSAVIAALPAGSPAGTRAVRLSAAPASLVSWVAVPGQWSDQALHQARVRVERRERREARERAERRRERTRRRREREARLARERAERAQPASDVSSAVASGSPQQIAQALLAAAGWGGQWICFDDIVNRESGWDVTAINPGTGAYGLGQALPGSKMQPYGADWATDAATQLRWMMAYIADTYGSPCAADAHERADSWY